MQQTSGCWWESCSNGKFVELQTVVVFAGQNFEMCVWWCVPGIPWRQCQDLPGHCSGQRPAACGRDAPVTAVWVPRHARPHTGMPQPLYDLQSTLAHSQEASKTSFSCSKACFTRNVVQGPSKVEALYRLAAIDAKMSAVSVLTA